MNLKKFALKILRVIISMKLLFKLKGFDFDNILIDENSHENILTYNILYKKLNGSKPWRIRFDKIDGWMEHTFSITYF